VVQLKDLGTGSTESYSILGAWDSDPDHNVISYQAAIAQAIIGRKVGEQVELPTEHGERRVEILSIEAYKKESSHSGGSDGAEAALQHEAAGA
jgi:transcription elongation GreA/GreB family factor